MDEFELKFGLPRSNHAGMERALKLGATLAIRLQAIYFDTADQRLRRHGLSLRLRKEGRNWMQTAKFLTGDSLRRLEHNVAIPSPARGEEPVIDLAAHDCQPVGEELRRALAKGDHSPPPALVERFRTDVTRLRRTMRSDDATVEVAMDTGRISSGSLSLPVSQVEFELKSGPATGVIELAARWTKLHGLWLSTISKAERGARLCAGELGGPPVKASAPTVDRKQDAARFLHATLSSCMAQILPNASEVGAGAANEEFVHQLRIGLRRLRTALKDLAADAEGIDPCWEESLAAAFHELGAHRDAAVVVPALKAALLAAGGPRIPESAAPDASRPPWAVMRDPFFQRTLLEILAFMHRPPESVAGPARSDETVGRSLAAKLRKIKHRLDGDAKHFATLEPSEQHAVRKRLKRLRYLSEFAGPLFGRRRVARYLDHWRAAQDALGESNDLRVAADIFRAQAPLEPSAWFAVGWLVAGQQATVTRAQAALRKASKKRAYWNQ